MLLSASRAHGTQVAVVDAAIQAEASDENAHVQKAANKEALPDMAGTWIMMTHTEFADIRGTMILEQNGKKVTGTLQNPGQPIGKIHLKLSLPKADAVATAAGKGVNFSVKSPGSTKVTGTVHDTDPTIDTSGDGKPKNDTNNWIGRWLTQQGNEIDNAFEAIHIMSGGDPH